MNERIKPRGVETSSRKTRVYLVDGNPLVRLGLGVILREEPDMEVCGEADTVETGLSGVIELGPDLVIVDITIQGCSGLELIKQIRSQNRRTRILVLSLLQESVYAVRALKAGAHGYLPKDGPIDQIIQAIRQVRDGRLFISESVADQMVSRLVKRGGMPAVLSPMETLSDREIEVITLIGQGVPTREIASALHVSVKTIETHRAHIKNKLKLQTAMELVRMCVQWVEETGPPHEPMFARREPSSIGEPS